MVLSTKLAFSKPSVRFSTGGNTPRTAPGSLSTGDVELSNILRVTKTHRQPSFRAAVFCSGCRESSRAIISQVDVILECISKCAHQGYSLGCGFIKIFDPNEGVLAMSDVVASF